MRAWPGSPPAARRLVAAYGSLPREVIDLACHAAVPVAVDVGLLHLLRVNFLLDPPVVVPYEAEADLLLSPLVRELGDGLYDIDPVLRPLLLTGLSRRFGPARPRRVAALLEQYALRAPAWQDRPELVHAQRLTAVAVIDPPLAADWLARAETSIADGSALLATEWLVAVRRSVGDHAPAERPAGEDVADEFDALLSEAGEDRVAAVHRLGELALVPGADVEAIVRALAAHADDAVAGPTVRAVLDTIGGLGTVLGVTDGRPESSQRTAREQLLSIWRAVAAESYVDGVWQWSPGETRSSISDAQQLLCLLLPPTEIPDLAFDRPADITNEVLDALVALGDYIETPKLLMNVLLEYLLTYRSEDGTPLFTGALVGASAAQAALDLTEAYAVSVRLMLAALRFTRVFRAELTRHELITANEELERLAEERLTAALVGLLRSFTVFTFATDSEPGQRLLRSQRPRIMEDLRTVAARLAADVTIGPGSYEADQVRHRPDLVFECGWSWGIIRDAPVVETAETGRQQQGWASPAPDLWCTMLAMTAIDALGSERTRLVALLDDEQLRLTRSLQLRHELTAAYWTARGIPPDHRREWLALTPFVENGDYFALLVAPQSLDPVVPYRLDGAESIGPPLEARPVDRTPVLLLQLDRRTADGHEFSHHDEVLTELLRSRWTGPDGTAGLWHEWATTLGAVEVFTQRCVTR